MLEYVLITTIDGFKDCEYCYYVFYTYTVFFEYYDVMFTLITALLFLKRALT